MGEEPKLPRLGCQLQLWEAGLAMSTLPRLYHRKNDFPAIHKRFKAYEVHRDDSLMNKAVRKV